MNHSVVSTKRPRGRSSSTPVWSEPAQCSKSPSQWANAAVKTAKKHKAGYDTLSSSRGSGALTQKREHWDVTHTDTDWWSSLNAMFILKWKHLAWISLLFINQYIMFITCKWCAVVLVSVMYRAKAPLVCICWWYQEMCC